MKITNSNRAWLAPALLLGLFVGCHSSNSAVTIDDSCVINSDCPAPWVCVSGTCHVQCRDNGDCAAPDRCVAGACKDQSLASGGSSGDLLAHAGAGDSNADDSGGMRNAGTSGTDFAGAPDSESAGAAGESCVNGGRELGQIGYWCSKVNVHWTIVGWQTDADCTSGCNEDALSYCKKFWPTSVAYEQVSLAPEKKPFDWAGCANVEYSRGETQYRCCAAP